MNAVTATFADMIQRYKIAQLARSRQIMSDERQAQYATQYATEDAISQFKKYCREQSESYALEVLSMETEDIEKATARAAALAEFQMQASGKLFL